MTLLERVAARLGERDVPFALIGAGALAACGVARSTFDHDLLVADAAVLDASFWAGLGAQVDARRGDADEPLRGVVRIRREDERDVDVVVGRHAWQREVVERASPAGNRTPAVPVVQAADLVLLKLYAGGSQDRWDIEQLLAIDDDGAVARDVQARLAVLPQQARTLWEQLRGAR